jgi:excisionase family DNA binding protein
MKRLLTPEETADILQVGSETIREWLRAGEIRGIKTGRLWRVEESAIEEYLSKQRELMDFADEEWDRAKETGNDITTQHAFLCGNCNHKFVIHRNVYRDAAEGKFPHCPKCDSRVEADSINEESGRGWMKQSNEIKKEIADKIMVELREKYEKYELRIIYDELKKILKGGD